MTDIEKLKEKGNAALAANKTNEAINAYSQAIKLDKYSHELFSNRSAAYYKEGKYQLAFEDADRAVQLHPYWAKGFYRKGVALEGLKRYDEAFIAFEEGLKLEKNNEIMLKRQEDLKKNFIDDLLRNEPKSLDAKRRTQKSCCFGIL